MDHNVDLATPNQQYPGTPALAESQERSGITVRAIMIGSLLTAILAFVVPYNLNIIQGSYLALDHNAPGAIALFFVLVLVFNIPLKIIGIPLSRSELLTIYVMLIIASALASMGLASQLPPFLVAPSYFATDVNQWQQLFVDKLPDWVLIKDQASVTAFYEGLNIEGSWWSQENRPIIMGLLKTWLVPLGCWALFLFSLYWVMICIMVIIRKQWMEKEILPYPLVKLALAMVEQDPSRPSAVAPIFRNKLLWIGFAIPTVVSFLTAMSNILPDFPKIPMSWSTDIFNEMATLTFLVSFAAIGFAFLINLEVSFSIWSFGLLGIIITGAMTFLGLQMNENLGIYGSAGNPILYHIGMGAMLGMVIYGLWVARAHLRDVLAKALGRDPSVDDSKEILSYRVAVFGALIGTTIMVVWLWCCGMPIWVAIVVILIALAIFFALSRVVVEGGMAAVVAPGISPTVTTSGLGASAITSGGLVSMALTYVWCADVRTFVMAPAANSLKALENVKTHRRRLIWAMGLAILITFVISTASVIVQAYAIGAINMNTWFFRDGPQKPYEFFTQVMAKQTEPNIAGWQLTLVGAGILLLFAKARHRFTWWPLHPIGLIVLGTWIMATLWFSFFLAWLIKLLLVRYGGPKLYLKAIPFFYGLILGQFVNCGAWVLIDFCTGTRGNSLFWL